VSAAYRANGDGTVSDLRPGLMWSQAVDPQKVNLAEARAQAAALRYAENLQAGGQDDWRLPNARELQSIVDYTHGPASPAAPADPSRYPSTVSGWPEHSADRWQWTLPTHRRESRKCRRRNGPARPTL
jgi:hypothetical protein